MKSLYFDEIIYYSLCRYYQYFAHYQQSHTTTMSTEPAVDLKKTAQPVEETAKEEEKGLGNDALVLAFTPSISISPHSDPLSV